MLVAVSVCPHPPLLVPEVAAGAASETEEVRSAALAAVGMLLAARPDQVVVVGSGPSAGTARPTDRGTLAPYGVPVTVAISERARSPQRHTGEGTSNLELGGPAAGRGQSTMEEATGGEALLPLSLTIGVWLLRRAGVGGTLHGRVVPDSTPPTDCLGLGARIAAYPGRTALLVMGDGSACRTPAAPGYVDARAVPFDDAVATALAGADTGALAALDPGLARELRAAGRAPWQVLAGAADGSASPSAESSAGPAWRADLAHYSAPYGVAYFVASWLPA